MIRYLATMCFGLLCATSAFAQPGDLYFLKKPQPVKKEKQTGDAGDEVPKQLLRYLTKDGLLRAPIEVRDEKRGFGVFFGTHWRIAPDGSFSSVRIMRNKPRQRGQGKLSKKELIVLATILVQADPLTLPSAGRPLVNSHVATIAYGPTTAVLVFGIDQKLGGGGIGAPLRGNVAARFAAIAGAVQGAIEPHIGPEPPLPRRLR